MYTNKKKVYTFIYRMKKIYIVIIALCLCPAIYAGQSHIEQTTTAEDSARTDKPLHWYIGVDAGAQIFDGMCDSRLSFGSRIAPVGSVTFGREINNWLNLDVNVSVAGFRGLYVRPVEDKHFATNEAFDLDNKTYYQKGTYMQFYARAGFDLNTIFAGYKASRKGSFVPYVGVGVATGLGRSLGVNNAAAALTLDYGLQYKLKVGSSVSLLWDFHGAAITKGLEGESCDEHSLHGIYGLKFGVLFNLRNNK